MSTVDIDRDESRLAGIHEETYGPAGGPLDSSIYVGHPWACLCPRCEIRHEQWKYPGPCKACGSELRRTGNVVHLRDGQDSILCRGTRYLHTIRDTPRTPRLTEGRS